VSDSVGVSVGVFIEWFLDNILLFSLGNILLMGDNNTLGFFGRLGKGIYTKPKNEQEFKIELDEFKEAKFTSLHDTTETGTGVDRKRKDKLRELKKNIAEAIKAYLIFNKKDSPVEIKKNDYGGYDIEGLDKLFEQALTKITITKPNGAVNTYKDEDLKTEILDKHHISFNNEDKGFRVSELLDRMCSIKDGSVQSILVDAGKATLIFTFDMTKLLSPSSIPNSTGAGHRRSSHKIVRKTFKHSKRHSRSKSRKSSRKYRNRK